MNSLGFRSVFALAALTSLAACSASTSGGFVNTDGGTDSGVTGDGGPCAFGSVKCDGVCVKLATDSENCGMCGKACPTGQSCSAGLCKATPCTGGQTECGGKCVSTQNDPANCGMCGKACPSGQVCSLGACSLTCASPQVRCTPSSGGDAYCANLANDTLNCGSCGERCATGESCVSGSCKIMCGFGQTECSGVCRNLQTDATNCGFCGNTCATGESCVAGTCTLVCSGGLTKCGTSCVSTASDASNCGSCGNVCPTRANSTPSCVSSACRFTCDTGYADCNTVASDGCEVSLMTSSTNCGMCGRTCSSGQTCVSGTCTTSTGTKVLIFNDSDTGTLADDAVTALGHTFTLSDATDFITKFDAGGFNLVIIDSDSNYLPTGADTRLATWVNGGNRLVFAYWDLDASTTMKTAFGVSTVSFDTIRPVYAVTTGSVNLFTTPRTFPSPLTGTDDVTDDGDVLTLTGAGFLAARFDSTSGGGAIAVTKANRVIVNGFCPPEFETADSDGDGIKDMRELWENEIVWVLTH